MSRYVNSGEKYSGKSSFAERFAKHLSDKELTKSHDETSEFSVGYSRGKLRVAVASKHLNLVYAGQDRYVEDKNGLSVVWEREGDQIVRVDSDTSWIDELLNTEGKK